MESNVLIFTCVTGRIFQRALGAYQLAHFVRKHGYTVQVIDFTDDFTEIELKQLVERHVGPQTLAVGVSSTFYTMLRNSYIEAEKTFDPIFPPELVAAVRHAKTVNREVKVVLGGAKSLAAESFDWVDCVIHGYAEDKFLMYLDELSGRKRRFIQLGTRAGSKRIISADPVDTKFNVETLDHTFAPHDYILPGETLPIEVSRGCIFRCKFCAYPLNGKKKMDYLRHPDHVRAELIYNYENYGTTNYHIGDDTFNDSTFKVRQLHEVFTSLPFKISFAAYLRADLLHAHPEQIQLLDEMGLASAFFGIESLHQPAASAIGKGMNVEKLKEFVTDVYYNRWRGEKPITCSFIIGLPHETEETVQRTFDWVKETKLSSVFFPLVLTMNSFYKSEFNVNYRDYGYTMDETTGYWENAHFNMKRATELANRFNDELMYKNDYPSSFFLMALLSHGIPLEEARTTLVSNLPWPKILRDRKRKIAAYKSLVLDAHK